MYEGNKTSSRESHREPPYGGVHDGMVPWAARRLVARS